MDLRLTWPGVARDWRKLRVTARIEHLMAMLWAIATVLAVVGSAWTLVPIGLANGVLLLCGPPLRCVLVVGKFGAPAKRASRVG